MVMTLFVLLFGLLCLLAPANSQITICSTFCATNGCTGWTMSDCNTSCYSGWTYSTSLGTCDFANTTNQAVMAFSDDQGGDIQMDMDPGDGCKFNGNTYYYGKYKASQKVKASLTMGTYTPHYAFDVYFNLILVDTNQGGSQKWDNQVRLNVTLLNSNAALNQVKSKTLKVSGSGSSDFNAIASTTSACGTNKDDKYYRMVYRSYTHSDTGTPFDVTVQFIGNDKADAVWNMREMIFVAYTCNVYCLTCFDRNINQCYSCDASVGYMLSGTTCATSCLTGYGATSDPSLCVLCSSKCNACFEVADNCASCKSAWPNTAYLYYNDTVFYYQCVNPCPTGYYAFVNGTSRTCQLCDASCTACTNSATYCTACVVGYGWYGYGCYMPCNVGLYYSNGTNNCTVCPAICTECTSATNCSVCTTTAPNVAYLLASTCYRTCPLGHYGTSSGGINVCLACAATCASCTGYPTPCLSCVSGTYLYEANCSTTCPTGYVAYALTNQCLNCDQFCVDLTISIYFPVANNAYLYIDMNYTLDLNFSTFNYQTFQNVTISNNDISNFDVSYQLLDSKSYRIIVKPKGFIFLYNETVTVTTEEPPSDIDTSVSLMPFKTTNYLKTATNNWFLLNPPGLSDMETSIINGLGSVNDVYANATTSPVLAEIKKSGVFAMLFSGAHITTSTILVNSVPPQNLYEAGRFFGVSTLYDVPPWQRSSSRPNNFMGNQLHNLTLNQRRLFNLESLPWRYQRTGMTSFFIYDVYIPVSLIVFVWLMGALGRYLQKKCKYFIGYDMKFYTVLHKIHEFSIIYVTTAMILEWMYFDAGSLERWVSLLVCIVFTVYFVGYHLYIYYDMIRYPEAMIGNERYEHYITRYSTFLKNLRYEEYDMKEQWSWRHWFRPYNFHILSYYKKFCMIVSLPLFYDTPKWSTGVLIFLQLLEMVRFVLSKPYHACWRNVYRFCLQFFLLLLFIVVYANTFIIEKITLNGSDVLYYVDVYYKLGWVGFAMIFLFNLGFVVQTIFDTVQGFRKNNREMMEQARRSYYYGKITDYEKEYQQVPLGLMNRWVKLGNLNARNRQELPDINVRVEQYRLIKHKEYYDVDVMKAVELFMNTDFNYHKENNTTPGKVIRKKLKLSKQVSQQLFKLIDQLYSKYAKKETEAMVIKTFMPVRQRDFQAGDRVPLLPAPMFQKLQLESFTGDKEQIQIKQKLQGFPINPHDIQSLWL